jgi:hypothetical protein
MINFIKHLILCSLGEHELWDIWMPANEEGVAYFIYGCRWCAWNEVHSFPKSQTIKNVPGLRDLFKDVLHVP